VIVTCHCAANGDDTTGNEGFICCDEMLRAHTETPVDADADADVPGRAARFLPGASR
jgi:hypothetical protein